MRIFGHFLKGNTQKLSYIAGFIAAVGLLSSGSVAVTHAAVTNGVNCDNNAIISCGFKTPDEFITDVKNNTSKNGHSDLQTIYKNYGLTSADYANFAAHALPGTVDDKGNVTVSGQVVATDADSIGRIASFQGPGYFTKAIGSGTYYGNAVGKTLASGVTTLPIYVLFNANGEMQFAAMKACGNPVFGHTTPTSASCKELTETPVSGKLNTYSFTATANTAGNAKVTKYVYDFGDGSAPVTMTSGTTAVTHTYTKAGTFTATVTEFASVPGNSSLQLPVVSTCKRVITVKLPFYSCVQLVGAILDKSKMEFSFTASADFGNGATFTGADFDFGDGHTQTSVKPTTTTTAVVTHTYATSGQYNAMATLHFSVNGSAVSAPTCKALVTPETVTPECKPGVPVGSPDCLPPCQPGSSVPPDSPQCTPPTLPNTGAGNTIAIFGGVIVVGFLVYRQLIFKRHRAAFVAAEQGSSPLPLADPLNSDAPLAGTPLATKRRSAFRRKRPF